MRRVHWYPLLLMLLVPSTSSALQLRWSTGSTDLNFTSATRCTLEVRADSTEGGLPGEWRLLWLADSSGVTFIAMGSSAACEAATAQISTIEPPATSADSAANLITARFCSFGEARATEARWVLDQPGGSHCRLKVVALDPGDPDSSHVITSNEVTCNGGVDGQYFPAILHVRSNHSTSVLQVDVVGSALEGLSSVSVSAPQLGGNLPLALVTRTDTTLSATADICVPLPTSQVRFTTPEREFPLGEVPADQVVATTLPYRWVFRDQDTSFVYEKDFAFINAPLPIDGEWQNLYHLYYIRHYTDGGQRRRNEFALGHAWSRDLEHWNSSRFAFVADTLHPTRWDGAEVWAPSIIQAGGMYHMFYAGLDSVVRDQTIGYATAAYLDTTDLPGHWTRRSTPTLTPANASNWVYQGHDWQFRDPFVMADPEDPSRLLLFYVAPTQADPGHLVVGLFQSDPGDLDHWTDLGFYEKTTSAINEVVRLESPHVFPDGAHHQPGQSAAATWRLMYTDGDWHDLQRAVLFNNKAVGAPLTDTRAVSWSDETGLGSYLGFTTSSPEYGVQASEILQVGGTYYWGGYNGDELVFRKLNWGSPPTTDFTLEDVDFLAVDQPDLPVQVRLRLAELRLGLGTVRFRIELPAPMRAEVAVYDLMARLVRRLDDKLLAAGASEVTWDGRDRSGAVVGSGVYFARLRAGSASQVVRVPLVR